MPINANEELSDYDKYAEFIKPTKSRKEIMCEYGIDEKQFKRRLKYHNIILPPGAVFPREQLLIIIAFGPPSKK